MKAIIEVFEKRMWLRNDCRSWNNVGGDLCKKLLQEGLLSFSHVQICGIGGRDTEDLHKLYLSTAWCQ